MKTVVCFGDSNTWGYDPLTRERFDRDTRWPGVLRNELGEGYLVLEEGLNGRTTVWDDPVDGAHKNGSRYLLACLESHAPSDLVVIMLGTNDLKRRFGVPAEDIARGAARLVGIARQSMCGPRGDAPQVLLVAPPPTTKLTRFSEMFEGAGEKSRRFGARFQAQAEEIGCPLLNAADEVVTSDLYGIHLEADQHQRLGRAVALRVRELLE